MKKSLKRKLSFTLVFTFIITCFSNITSFALISGYNNATEISGSVTEYIVGDNQNDWYKFTVTETDIPAPYTISLRIPTDCVYNFDLWYRPADSTGRPSVVSNETIVASNRNRKMSGVFTQAGTYFVRVYSQDGYYIPIDSYRLNVSFNKNTTYTFSFGSGLPSADAADWSICADLLGNHTYDVQIQNSASNRNYKNAYSFITSNYTSDDESGYRNESKATPEQTAIAANYIYAGDLLLNPRFKVETNKIYEIEELMYLLWGLDKPVIFYLNNDDPAYSLPAFTKYVILESVNIGNNTITYYYPSGDRRDTVDYDEFLTDGILYYNVIPLTYKGTNIINTNTIDPVQPIYN